MGSIFGRVPDHELSTLVLNRPIPDMPPLPIDRDLPYAGVIEISDDDDAAVSPAGVQKPPARPTATMNIRLKPDTSPTARRDSKRQKLDEAPEAPGSRVQYPHARLDFTESDDGFSQAYPAFFDDAFAFTYHDDSSDSSVETAARLLEQAAVRQARRPPYYEDPKFKLRMYCGPGYEHFPLPVNYDPKFQEACDAYDAEDDNGNEYHANRDPLITIPQQDCLARILDVFPDINHKFVLDKITSQRELIQFPDEEVEMHPDSATIIEEILEMDAYPKQPKPEEQPSNEFESRLGKSINWNRNHYQNANYKKDAVALLAVQFDHVPTHFINSTVTQKGNLFDAYIVIEDIESDYFQGDRPYSRSKRPRVQLEKKYQNPDPQLDPPYYCSLVVELQAVKQHVLRKKLQSNQQQQIADAEVANLEQHRLDGLLVQCKCCFDEEVPINRTVVCLADGEHPFCYDCVKNLAENQIGMRRHEMQCMDESGCNKALDLDGIGRAVPIKTFDRLQFNQQQAEIKAANIEGLEQCPLCDFQAICDPIEVDTIFSCQNPDCFKVTCRLCHEASHLPKTCEEVKKDRGLSARHKVEEARTQAMIRTCPSCQSAIIKSDGCNKMRCTCGSVICYACKLDLSQLRDAYEHFSRGIATGKKCPLYDDKAIDRHVQEANEAEEKAIQAAKAEDNTIEENTLRIETGNGKAVDRRGQINAIQGGPIVMRPGDPDVMDYVAENLERMQQNQRLMVAQVEDIRNRVGRREARRPKHRGFMRNARNAQWMQDLQQRIAPAPVPVAAGFEPPQGREPLLPPWSRDQNAPMAPFAQNRPDQNTQGGGFGIVPMQGPPRNQQLQQNLGVNQVLADGFGDLNHGQNQDQNNGRGINAFGSSQQPRPDDADVFNNTYINTAQRIHNFRDQQERRRRSQVERRNTIHNEARPQVPNPGVFNIRININDNPQPFPNQTYLGTQPPAHDYLAEAYRDPLLGADPDILNVINDHNIANDNVFNDYLHARNALFGQNQNQNQNPVSNEGWNQNQSQNQNVTQQVNTPATFRIMQPRQHQMPNIARARTWQNLDYMAALQNREVNRISDGNGNGNLDGNTDRVMNRGRPNRRQTMPLEELDAGVFGNPWNG